MGTQLRLATGWAARSNLEAARREGARSDIDASPNTFDGPSAVRCNPSMLWQLDPRERSYEESCFKFAM